MTTEEIKAMAMSYFDDGYWFDDCLPGKLMLWGSSESIDVPTEVWWFFVGIRFGFGEMERRRLKSDPQD